MMGHLDEIRGRLNAATPGPWRLKHCAPCTERGRLDLQIWDQPGNLLITNWCDEDEHSPENAEFIANAPTDVARLLSAVQAVLDLHKPLTNSTSALHPEPLCTCDAEWPCETVEALTTALEGR